MCAPQRPTPALPNVTSKRGSELLKTDFISEAEYDRLEAQVDITQANLDLARKALTDSEIYAPFSWRHRQLCRWKTFNQFAPSHLSRACWAWKRWKWWSTCQRSQMANVHHIETIEVEFDALPGVRLPATITEIGREAS